MSNSKLVAYSKISPNRTCPRNSKIDTISIHCYVGQASIERMGDEFFPLYKSASCNYGVGSDGRIGMYVEEKDRSWCTSSQSNDHRAVTIEVACDTVHPYKVNDKAFSSLILLLADICERNDIKELKWKGDKSLIGQVDKQNLTVHRWFASKSCPGDYLYNKHSEIVDKVNGILGVKEQDKEKEKEQEEKEKVKGDDEMVDITKVIVEGEVKEISRIFKENTNFLNAREIGECLGFNVSYDNGKKMPVFSKK
ncbi:MAG: N-acetylmuramoyl-L-alanine amidase [Lachnospirales bacterium]